MVSDDLQAFKDFYESSIVDTIEGSLQIFHSFTYGEMIIAFLLLLILLLQLFKWVWEVLT